MSAAQIPSWPLFLNNAFTLPLTVAVTGNGNDGEGDIDIGWLVKEICDLTEGGRPRVTLQKSSVVLKHTKHGKLNYINGWTQHDTQAVIVALLEEWLKHHSLAHHIGSVACPVIWPGMLCMDVDIFVAKFVLVVPVHEKEPFAVGCFICAAFLVCHLHRLAVSVSILSTMSITTEFHTALLHSRSSCVSSLWSILRAIAVASVHWSVAGNEAIKHW